MVALRTRLKLSLCEMTHHKQCYSTGMVIFVRMNKVMGFFSGGADILEAQQAQSG